MPKDVLLTHKNVIAISKAYCAAVVIKNDYVFMCFLSFARDLEVLCESVCLLDNGITSVLQPTCLTVVSFILDRMLKGINKEVNRSGPFRRAIFQFRV